MFNNKYLKPVLHKVISLGGYLANSRINSVTSKKQADYMTDIDLTVQMRLIDFLKRIDSNASFIAEEQDTKEALHKEALSCWFIDPVDGTTNLIHGYRSSCISLAHASSGQIDFGCVFNPFSHELFYSTGGKSILYNTLTNSEQVLNVSKRSSLAGSLIGFGFPYDKSKSEFLLDKVNKLFNECDDLKRKGPASLDLCYVAAGRLDAYFELDLKPWDYAAGGFIVYNAGGQILTWGTSVMGSSPLDYNSTTQNSFPGVNQTNIVAGNSIMCDNLLSILNEAPPR